MINILVSSTIDSNVSKLCLRYENIYDTEKYVSIINI